MHDAIHCIAQRIKHVTSKTEREKTTPYLFDTMRLLDSNDDVEKSLHQHEISDARKNKYH